MEARPISTDPITYLDKDGNQQVCTAYTVLTSETKASILDYADNGTICPPAGMWWRAT